MDEYDILIVGAGPTGIQVAIDAKKAGLHYKLIEKGSLVNSIYHFPKNMTFFSTSMNLEIAGVPFVSHNSRPTRNEALEYYRRLMTTYEIKACFYEEVTDVDKQGNTFNITTKLGRYQAKNVVIATGFYSIPNLMHIPGEELPHVSHYYDDPHVFIDQKVVVIGAANSAVVAAIECWQKGANVTMLIRGNNINERVKYWIRPNIINRINEGSIQAEFRCTINKIDSNSVHYTIDNQHKTIQADFVLALTGYQPDYTFLRKIGIEIEENDEKMPMCMNDTLESNIKGLYLAGVVNCGLVTHKLFIENTREHGKKIISHILKENM